MDYDGDAVYGRLKAMVLQDLGRDPHAEERYVAMILREHETSPTYRKAIEDALAEVNSPAARAAASKRFGA